MNMEKKDKEVFDSISVGDLYREWNSCWEVIKKNVNWKK